jgi:hypothetical protein
MDWLGILLGIAGGVGGALIGGPAGAAAGFGIGGGLAGLIEGGSSDPAKTADQDYLRMLSHQLAQAPTGDASMFNQVGGQLASRGLGNSGVAGSAYASLFAELAKQRSSNIMGAAGILQGGFTKSQSNAGAGGELIGNSLQGLSTVFGKDWTPKK